MNREKKVEKYKKETFREGQEIEVNGVKGTVLAVWNRENDSQIIKIEIQK